MEPKFVLASPVHEYKYGLPKRNNPDFAGFVPLTHTRT